MATLIKETDFVGLIVREISCGIDDALGYWFGRIERELARTALNSNEQLGAIELILWEYKETTGKLHLRCAEA